MVTVQTHLYIDQILHSCELTQKHLPPFPQTDIEITREEDFARILQMEEEFVQQMCEHLIKVKPDLIITEKGISGKTHVDKALGSSLFISLLGKEGM